MSDYLGMEDEMAADFHNAKQESAKQEWDLHHGLAVARQVLTSDAKLVAILHDAVEDGACTIEDLHDAVPAPVYLAVALLTRRSGWLYEAYIDQLDHAEGYVGYLARAVKVADLTVNLARMDDDHRRLEPRYVKAREQLAALRYRP